MGVERKKGWCLMMRLYCVFKGHDIHIRQSLCVNNNKLEVRFMRVCSRCGKRVDDTYDVECYKKES